VSILDCVLTHKFGRKRSAKDVRALQIQAGRFGFWSVDLERKQS
jgi:hypothetical protein